VGGENEYNEYNGHELDLGYNKKRFKGIKFIKNKGEK